MARRKSPRKPCKPGKAGCELHRLIAEWTGQTFRPGCGCKAMVKKMNANGPEWCRANIKTIVAKMREETKKRKWWKAIVRIPGTSTPMRWMVEEAIKRAEARMHTNGH